MPDKQPATPKLRWFHLTPGRLLVVLLVVEAVLLLSERFKWFSFNEYKGWTVLIAVAAVGLFLLFMLIWFVFALLFRRRFQFSIRSLLALTIAVALPFSWLAMEIKMARKQKEAVEVIRKKSVISIVFYDRHNKTNRYLNTFYPSSSGLLTKYLGDDFFCDPFEAYANKYPASSLQYLQTLTTLEEVTLHEMVFMHKQELDSFKNHKRLRKIDLSLAKLDDIDLEPITSLTELQELDLSYTNITDTGLPSIKGFSQLQKLNLSFTDIHDSGLVALKGLRNLKVLSLSGTHVSDDGIIGSSTRFNSAYFVRGSFTRWRRRLLDLDHRFKESVDSIEFGKHQVGPDCRAGLELRKYLDLP